MTDDIQWNGGWQQTWESLEGILISNVAVTSWASDRLDIFGLGTNSAVYHHSWDGSTGGWQDSWDLLQGTSVGDPSAASWSADRLDVFMVESYGSIQHRYWNGSYWSETWESVGQGPFDSLVSVVSWGPGRLDLFALDMDHSMLHRAYDASSFGWQSSWDTLQGGPFASTPPAVSWAANRLDVFGMLSDGSYQHNSWDASNGSVWTGWEDIGRPGQQRVVSQSSSVPPSDVAAPTSATVSSLASYTAVPTSTPTSDTSNSNTAGLSEGAKIGIGIGAAGVVCLAIAVGICWFLVARHRKTKSNAQQPREGTQDMDRGLSHSYDTQPHGWNSIPHSGSNHFTLPPEMSQKVATSPSISPPYSPPYSPPPPLELSSDLSPLELSADQRQYTLGRPPMATGRSSSALSAPTLRAESHDQLPK